MHDLNLKETENLWHGTKTTYAIGFIGSLLLTLIAFALVYFDLMTGRNLAYMLGGLAFTQAVIQLRYFLHLGEEGAPFWETWIFAFMLLILLIVVIGSLWIMFDLNERMMMNM